MNNSGGAIAVSDTLLEYGGDLQEILVALLAASEALSQAITVYGGEIYRGAATEEIMLFLNSLYQHIDRLILLYSKHMKYIYNTYTNMKLLDQQLADSIRTTIPTIMAQ